MDDFIMGLIWIAVAYFIIGPAIVSVLKLGTHLMGEAIAEGIKKSKVDSEK